ncbi:glutathione-S-transferase [Infundibulicybe gibba]|nr:glutathione-S-transferase [Infundibulicybe gibba]
MSVPDEQIFPHATGPAAETVKKHQTSEDLIFYSGWFCPYVQRSWIALEERGIPYQYKEVNPYKKEKHFLDINPKGLVPAVDQKPNLLPSDPAARATARIWVDHISKTFIPSFQRLLQAQEAEKQAAALADTINSLKKLMGAIKGPFFLGEEFSLVDVAIAPWIMRDYVIQEHRGFKRSAVGDAWVKYAAQVEKRDSVVKTQSERQHLDTIYGRYLRDEAQSEAAKAIREGRPIP